MWKSMHTFEYSQRALNVPVFVCTYYLHINPERVTLSARNKYMKPEIHTADQQHSKSTQFAKMLPAFCLHEAEYSSGPCNPLTVICPYQHSIKPTDTFKQSALLIKKRVLLCKEGAKNSCVGFSCLSSQTPPRIKQAK